MTQEIFQNNQIDLSQLPAARDIEWQPLQPAYRQLRLLNTTLWSAAGIAAVSIILPLAPVHVWIPLAAYALVVLFTALQVLFIVRGFPYKGFALRSRDIFYRTGWLYKRQTSVPYNRIQHVDLRQGVFERAFGLCKLNIYTAGGQSSDITIPGLTDDTAQQIKEYILRETISQDEEE